MKLVKLHIDDIIKFNKIPYMGNSDHEKRSNEIFKYFISKILKHSDNEYKVNMDALEVEISKDSINPRIWQKLINFLVDNDNYLKNRMIFLYKYYSEKSNFRKFIPSFPLMNILSNIKADVLYENLPDNYDAYFDLCEHDIKINVAENNIVIKYILINIHVLNNKKVFSLFFGTTDTSLGMILSCQIENNNITAWNQLNSIFQLSEFQKNLTNLAINLVLYTSSPSMEFINQFNEFSKDNKQKQKQISEGYTKEKFIPIGHDAEFLRVIKDQEFGVKGHFKWVKVGKGRQNIELRWWNPFTKKLKQSWDDV